MATIAEKLGLKNPDSFTWQMIRLIVYSTVIVGLYWSGYQIYHWMQPHTEEEKLLAINMIRITHDPWGDTRRCAVDGHVLSYEEEQSRLKYPPGFFAHHYYLSTVLGFFIILGMVSSGGTTVLTMFYSSSGAFTGYSRSYIPGGVAAVPVILFIGILLYYIWFVIMHPGIGFFIGSLIDCYFDFVSYVFTN